MSNPVAQIFREAARLNSGDQRRRGNVVQIDDDCEMIVSGDLHGNRQGLNRIIGHAALGPAGTRRLVLQEIVHGPIDPKTGHDRSIEVLLRAARLKLTHPRDVLFLMGNHDVAEVTQNEITRDGQPSLKTFSEGIAMAFEDGAEEVRSALKVFLLSQPLAVRAGPVMISHSLPSRASTLDSCCEVLDRPYTTEDLRRGGPVYEWTWGRRHTPEIVDDLAKRLGVEFFIMGHYHSPLGHEWITPRAVTLASDHQHGCLMQFSTRKSLTAEAAQAGVKPLVMLG